ncbi:TonB-dependent receptor [Aurantiacibacter poecillastricola]|uniref:TonB-dependent receptor n=1 Tax=Aurantiacibacter poecillastricola TaxID=3064385 RepID=UPI00273F492C|nr:TonB-dependent receptor [Aurantiacibacter sp. 219JJ12-13]MDP5261299.1 TonB-dependent receptor [Aurantiacibacter sp. 219JJ12-13]
MKNYLACTTALALFPGIALAQEAGDPVDENPVILVTAERRAENVQDVPISIVALSGDTLRERGVDNLDDLTAEVPSLSFVDNGNTKYLNIRGVGVTESAPNQTVGVAVHLDGAYIAREFTFADAFFDLESIQVLRGPQGTYSGQNASGGAIFIESARPVLGDIDGYAQFTLGEYDRRSIEGAVSVPLGNQIAARFALKAETRDSYYTNLGPSGNTMVVGSLPQPGDRRNIVGRAQLLWEPAADFQFRLIHQFSNAESDGTPFQNDTAENRANPFILNYNQTPYSRNRTKYNRTTATARWDAVEAFQVNAVLAYQSTSHLTGGDYDRTGVASAQGFTALEDDYWTGEVNLLSMSDGPFEWTVGATFLDYVQEGDVYTERGPAIETGLGRNFSVKPVRSNQAVFGEVGYRFTDTLQLKVGARYNHERNGFERFLIYPMGGLDNSGPSAPFPSNNQFVTFNNMTGRVLLNYEPNPDHLFYATVSRGYKPGGITATAQEYDSEIVTNWEGGWKGTLLEGLLQGSVSAFWMDYDGFQATVQPDPQDPTSRRTNNVDNTRIKGVEAQLSVLAGGFTGDVAVSYLDTGYGDFDDTIPPGAIGNPAPIGINLEGRPLNFAPEFSLTGGLAYEIPVGTGFVTPSIRVSHTTEQWVTFFQLPYHRIDERTLVDLRLTYEPNDDWRITAYATNVFDEIYVSNAQQTTDGIGAFMLGAPQEFGVQAAMRF